MAWHRYTLVVIGLTASLCIHKGQSDGNSTVNSTGQARAEAVCRTPRCQSAADGMIKKAKLSVNPCEDFNEFACGRFIEETKIPDGSGEVWALTIIGDMIKEILHGIIIREAKPTDPQYLINMRRFYNSCFDEDTIEAVGLTPYFNEKEFVDDWPTLNPSWSGANFNLNEVIVRYSKVFTNSILGWSIMNDLTDNSRLDFYLSHANLQLSQKIYRNPRNDTILQAYEKYLVEIAVALNASRDVAEQDAKEVVDLEIELSKIKLPEEYHYVFEKIHNPVQLKELSTMYPELDIVGFIRSVFGLANITLADNEKIINFDPTYISNISQVVQTFSNRTLQNLFGFNFAKNRVDSLTLRTRQIRQEFDKVYLGTLKAALRWKVCIDSTSKTFGDGFGKQFVAGHYSERAKQDVNNMTDKIKQVFQNVIEQTTWMSNDSKAEALAKLAAMKRRIGYPDVGFEEADIEKKYRNYLIKADDYYGNRVLGYNQGRLAALATHGKPADKNMWFLSAHETNAYNDAVFNEIVFPAGILQKPFYSETFPDYMNYGAIGATIGHEILHGFDDLGVLFDENGTMRNWMSPKDRETFANKTQSIIDQNSNTYVDEANMTLGAHTQGETMSDSGGLKIAFRAYKNLVSKSGQQPRLPGLHLSQDQLFFLSFAQLHCAKYTTEFLVQKLVNKPHPSGKYRILLTLQNTEDFARAFHCPEGSFMNPTEKYNVWEPDNVLDPIPLGSQGNRRVSFSLELMLLHFIMLKCYIYLVLFDIW